MFKPAHSFGFPACRRVERDAFLLPRILSPCLPFILSGLTLCSTGFAEEELTAVRSYDGNFLITAPDHLTCGWAARFAERTREKVFSLLDYSREWDNAASVILRSQKRQTEAGNVTLWTITAKKGSLEISNPDIYPNKRGDALVLQTVHLCLADMAGLTLPTAQPGKAPLIPPWLWCGVAENLPKENLADLRRYAATIVRNGTFLPLEQLLGAEQAPREETQRELFFRESGSIVDFLLHREDGASSLRDALTRLQEEGDFTQSLLLAFSRTVNTVAQLEQEWQRFAVQQVERTIGGPRMLLWETKEALDRVLTVEIPTIDRRTLEKKTIRTDLTGLFRHRNRRIVQKIASEKASEAFSLSLRADPEYSRILQEYLEALTAIAQNNRSEFKRHFALAERLREGLEQSPQFRRSSENGDTGNQ